MKRYGRIFPVYATIVFFLWIIDLEGIIKGWYLQIATLLLIAVLVHFSWKFLRKFHGIADKLFFVFIGLQVLLVVAMLFIVPHFSYADGLRLPVQIKNFLFFLSNMTLTTPFSKDMPRMSEVFWSLAPEIYFYIMYPFIVIPLVHLGKKRGPFVTVVLIIGVTKILFDLDKEIVSLAAFSSMNIARASGFVAGVTIGTIYQTKGAIWTKISPVIKRPISSVLALVLLIGMQLGDWTVRDGQSITFMNFYYLLSSWIIAFVILNGIFSNSLIYKLFSKKGLVFLGIISYSIYLIHPNIILWTTSLFALLPALPQGVSAPLFILTAVSLTIGISYATFRLIEFLYFSSKKAVLVTTLAKEGEGDTFGKKVSLIRHPALKISFVLLIIFYLYTGSYSPTELVSRHWMSSSMLPINEKSLLDKHVMIPFVAQYDNLSKASIYLRYAKNAGETAMKIKHPAVLEFRLLDSSGKQLFESRRNAYIVEGSPRFGFGFPTITNAKGKTYKAELRLVNGSPTDQIFVDQTSMSFVSVYTTSKQTLLHMPWIFLLNRLAFVFTDAGFVFAFLFILFVFALTRFQVP